MVQAQAVGDVQKDQARKDLEALLDKLVESGILRGYSLSVVLHDYQKTAGALR